MKNKSIMLPVSLETKINDKTPLLLVFHAQWCQPCKGLAPILTDLSKQMGDGILIQKVDVDKEKSISDYFSVKSMPTLFLFQQGELIWKHVGIITKNSLEQVIKTKTVKPYLLK
ncbi:thioredoxin family protein [Flectobacillus sp. DC10W]|uniref:Thioredoxin n=1 Tax=Flectobacillus longus TaxID=2984207 RepID=A0ABT6YS84_9BACT|nr:thioredoxin family protein [Flectobacillus longus]MDI9866450.1 thioredoxin family protein [Flectobacillus longus]